MKITSSLPFAALLLGTTLLGQSAHSGARSQTFHVQGTITGPQGDDVVPGTEIIFKGDHESRTLIADNKGFYEADLPVGLYTMTTQHQWMLGGRNPYLQKYVRPLFRVPSPTHLTLNVTMFPPRVTCDIVVGNKSGAPATPEQLEEGQRDWCGGEEFFPVPSHDGVPFQLYIRYLRRSPASRGYVYSGANIVANLDETPVLVEYNLATLLADNVIYDAEHGTIEAKGRVIQMDESGAKQKADSMTIRIENGQAIRLP
jgi:hypothetical protein